MGVLSERRCCLLAVGIAAIIPTTLLLSLYFTSTYVNLSGSFPVLCSSTPANVTVNVDDHLTSTSACAEQYNSSTSTEVAETILHYATSKVVPQQSKSEVRISLDVLLRRRPCNFLVYGLGFDSRMWSAFNPGGFTLFLEEDPHWLKKVLQEDPHLRAEFVNYPTHLKDADLLLSTYKDVPECFPPEAFVQGNGRCKLALRELPKIVYEREWDLIMIDAPKGYFPEAPGRMAAIWTAAMMARQRKGEGHTDVFLHDVDRKVEKEFALEFLCEKYRVGEAGRLWHFRIPAARDDDDADTSFC